MGRGTPQRPNRYTVPSATIEGVNESNSTLYNSKEKLSVLTLNRNGIVFYKNKKMAFQRQFNKFLKNIKKSIKLNLL